MPPQDGAPGGESNLGLERKKNRVVFGIQVSVESGLRLLGSVECGLPGSVECGLLGLWSAVSLGL